MEVTLEGHIKRIGQTQIVGTNDTKVRELHLEVSGQYPQVYPVKFLKDKCDILDKYTAGKKVKINCNLQGREWAKTPTEIQAFLSLNGWKIEAVEAEQYGHTAKPYNETPPAGSNVDDDNLPF